MLRPIVFIAIISEHYESVSLCVVSELVPLQVVDPDLELRRGSRGREADFVLLALLPFPPSVIFFLKMREYPGHLGPLPKSASVLEVK